jgi:hypothetical protein
MRLLAVLMCMAALAARGGAQAPPDGKALGTQLAADICKAAVVRGAVRPWPLLARRRARRAASRHCSTVVQQRSTQKMLLNNATCARRPAAGPGARPPRCMRMPRELPAG